MDLGLQIKRIITSNLFDMVYIINCSNLKAGGGLQVADSICGQLYKYPQHRFVVVLSPFMKETAKRIDKYDNVEVLIYEIPNSLKSIVLGRDVFLDSIVENLKVNAVLTVFGPSLWRPRVPHLCGFARAQLLLKDSPYYKQISIKERIKHLIWGWSFKKSSMFFYTENHFISDKLGKYYRKVRVYTVSNYYNQVYDQPDKWRKSISLPKFEGVTCLSISANYPHKNFSIIPEVIRALKKKHPEFKIRFVLTFSEKELPVADDVKDSILFVGRVDVSECPYLYEQSEIMFMPTLLECFTATYPEAMRMGKPIVTTDLEFARGLCGDAACYYSAVDPYAAAEALYNVAINPDYAKQLVENGRKQLNKYDNYEQRTEKLIGILEELAG